MVPFIRNNCSRYVLALAYIAAGIIKTIRPQEKLTNLPWTKEYSAGTVKFIGLGRFAQL